MHESLLSLTDRADRVPVPVRVAVVVTGLGAFVLIDLWTGEGLVMTFPYALCVMAAAWVISRAWALATAAAAGLGGFLVAVSEDAESLPTVLVNHALRTISFVLFAILVAAVRRGMDDLVGTTRVDPMTGALSRHGFHDQLAAARARAQRLGAPIGVVYLDLDGLKRVNDEQGHAAGDALIRRFVDRVSRHLRSTDAFGRLGGDEFAIVLERAAPDVIDAVVGRILDDPGLPAVSCGVQVFEGVYPSAERMLAGADRQMYRDKRLRRGTPPR